MRRRVIFRVLVLLVVGAIINVAVVWIIATHGPVDEPHNIDRLLCRTPAASHKTAGREWSCCEKIKICHPDSRREKSRMLLASSEFFMRIAVTCLVDALGSSTCSCYPHVTTIARKRHYDLVMKNASFV